MRKYIFDVDGTLTPSRQRIDNEFYVWFSNFCQSNEVYLVSGSDKAKTIEQLGEFIFSICKRVYNCGGNDVWQNNINVRKTDWILPEDAHTWLSQKLIDSRFYRKTGNHFEHRPGMVNFSIVGRCCSLEDRHMYREWDEHKNERREIAEEFNGLFPDLEARVGGETGLDIAPKGADKSQILKDFWIDDEIYFYGDAMHETGNDYPLAKALEQYKKGKVFPVTNWQECWDLLKQETDE